MAATITSPHQLLARAESAHRASDHRAALAILADLKASGHRVRGVDRLRAECFTALGEKASAEQARREEIRWFEERPAPERVSDAIAGDGDWLEAALEAVGPYTMLSDARLRSLHRLAKAAIENHRPGDFVECGVAAGGSSALLAGCLRRYEPKGTRRVWCFDTFTGMPEPTAADRDRAGTAAEESNWGQGTCSAPERCVHEAASLFGAADRLEVRPGLFQDTLPLARPAIGSIALLHLDGDWYESTRVSLVELWDLVAPGGAIQIDDYGHWEGCRRAVDEFLRERGLRVGFERIDYTGVSILKPRGGER